MYTKRILHFLCWIIIFCHFKSYSQSASYPSIEKRTLTPKNSTYFIDPVNGNDKYDGKTTSRPWKSFKNLNHLILSSGNIVSILAPGDFNESMTLISRGDKDRPVKVKFSPGEYNFYPKKAFRTLLNIANTNDTPDSLKAIALYIQNSSHTIIQGQGAKLIMRGKMIETCIDHSSNVRIEGLTYDYKRPTVSELKVMLTTTSYADVNIHPDSKYSIQDSLLTWEGEGWRHEPISLWQVLDPKTNDLHRIDISMDRLRYVEIGKNKVRIYFDKNPGLKTGLIYQSRDITRDCAGFFLRNDTNIILKKINIYYMHGMGVVSQLSKNITVESVIVKPDPTSGRTCAAWADILHFADCSGNVIVKNCYLSAANDDAVNIHGVYLRIVSKPKPNQLLVRFMHSQTFGFNSFARGDSIALINEKSLLQYDSNVVTKSEQINDKDYLLTLANTITSNLSEKDVVENITRSPNIWIHDNIITRIPTRGILVTSRRPSIIERNLFKGTHYNAITIANDAASWYESGMVKNVIIRKNVFSFCGEPVISVNPENRVMEGYVHNNITITGNDFYLISNHALSAKSTGGILIRNNKFMVKDANWNIKNLFSFTDCSNPEINNNSFKAIRNEKK